MNINEWPYVVGAFEAFEWYGLAYRAILGRVKFHMEHFFVLLYKVISSF